MTVERSVVAIGLGAVGGLVARALEQGGARVHGVDPRPPDEWSGRAARSAEEISGSTWRDALAVVVATRATDVERALAGVPEEIPIVTLHNGMRPEAASGRAGPILRGVVDFAARRENGAVRCTRPGVVHLEASPVTEALARSFGPGPIAARAVSDIERHLWGKILFNASLDPVAALTGRTYGGVLGGRRSFRLFRNLFLEGCRIARSRGIDPAPVQGTSPFLFDRLLRIPVVNRLVGWAAAWAARSVDATMLADLRAGRPTEVHFLSGFLVREAAASGLPSPHHGALLSRFDADGRLLGPG